jgi:hypothetical protein
MSSGQAGFAGWAYVDPPVQTQQEGDFYYNIPNAQWRYFHLGAWTPIPTGGGGAVTSVSNADGSLTVSPTIGAVIASLNVANPNTWSGLQTFGNEISLGGAQLNVSALANGNLLQYNGTNWVNVPASSVGGVNSVSNSDGTLTISPTTGAVIASLNLAAANTWTATETFQTIMPRVDNTYSIGPSSTGTVRWASVNAAQAFQLFLSSGDANPTATLTALGILSFGPGGASGVDTQLFRSAVQTFDFSGHFNPHVDNGTLATIGSASKRLKTIAFGTEIDGFLASGDANPVVQLLVNANPAINFGPGGATALDTTISRSGVNSLSLPGTISSASLWTATQTFTPASGSALVLQAALATAGTTQVNSPFQDFIGEYWNGSTSLPYGGSFSWVMDSAGTTGHFSFQLNNNGVRSLLGRARSTGAWEFGANAITSGASWVSVSAPDGATFGGYIVTGNGSTIDNTTMPNFSGDFQFSLKTAGIIHFRSGLPSTDFATFSSAQNNFTNPTSFASGDLQLFNPGGTFKYSFVGAAIAAARNITLPLLTANDTMAVLGFAQTFTAAQTFNSSDLLLNNPAATFAYTFAGAAITAARTITMPLLTANDTMAVLGFAQSFTALQTFGNNISFGGATLNVTSLANGNILQYNGTNWVNVTPASVGATLTNRLTSDTPSVNGTTSSGLTISLAANTNYVFKGFLYVTTGATSGVNFQIHALASGAALVVFELTAHHAGITVLADDIAGVTTTVTTGVLGTTLVASLTYYCILSGTITVGANATTLQLDFVSTAALSNVKAGSFIEANTVA